jgi:hypothetical protein
MPQTGAADDRAMATQTDQPWMVFAGRPAPLADLLRSDRERVLRAQAVVDADDSEAAEPVLADVGTPPEQRPSLN